VAEFAGVRVFPGATTTVVADGPMPGATYQLWLTPGVDSLSFMILGGVLSDEAVLVGTATVDSAGLLAPAFAGPQNAQLGDGYQLMIGDPATRSWPAGTIEQIYIEAPGLGATAVNPVVSIPLLNGLTVSFSFPTGTGASATTARASATATFAVLVEVCGTVGAGVDLAPLRLYHYELSGAGYAWADITSRRTADAVCGLTSSFSPFALGIPDVPIVVDVVLTNKDQCKSGEWMTSTLPVFTNQGKCVSYFASGYDKPRDKVKPKGKVKK